MSRAAKRGSLWTKPREGPLYDYRLLSECRRSDPLHAQILLDSILAKEEATTIGAAGVGTTIGGLAYREHSPQTIQCLVRTFPPIVVCMIAGMTLGAYVGDNWVKHPHEAEAKFHEWLQNRASAESQ